MSAWIGLGSFAALVAGCSRGAFKTTAQITSKKVTAIIAISSV